VTSTATVTGGAAPLGFDWVQTASGSAGNATSPGADTQTLQVAFSADADGTFTYEVTVTDDENRTDTDTVNVTVAPQPGGTDDVIVNAGNIATARADNAGVDGQLNGSISQQGADPADLQGTWSVTSQPTGSCNVIITNANDLNSTFNITGPALPGDYVFQLDGQRYCRRHRPDITGPAPVRHEHQRRRRRIYGRRRR